MIAIYIYIFRALHQMFEQQNKAQSRVKNSMPLSPFTFQKFGETTSRSGIRQTLFPRPGRSREKGSAPSNIENL